MKRLLRFLRFARWLFTPVDRDQCPFGKTCPRRKPGEEMCGECAAWWATR